MPKTPSLTPEKIINILKKKGFNTKTTNNQHISINPQKKYTETGKWFLTTEPDSTTGNNLDFSQNAKPI